MLNLTTKFQVLERKSSLKTEFIAGLTTFVSMAYVLAVIPQMLSSAGMSQETVFFATALGSGIACLLMAFLANIPVALAPGMGSGVFFAYTIVLGSGHSWQEAITAVFIASIAFVILSLTKFRESIFTCVPLQLKYAISAGIGLFVALLGFKASGIIVGHDATLVTMGDLTNPTTLLAVIGIICTAALLLFRVTGALLLGIVITTIVGIPMGVTNISNLNFGSFLQFSNIEATFLHFDFGAMLSMDMVFIIFTLFLMHLFDTLGTLIAVGSKGGLLDANGELPQAKPAFMADALGSLVGAVLGVSTVTSYVESASGIAAGGRTGLTALVVALLFLLALFLAPIFLLIPAQATAPALIFVALFMFSGIRNIDFEDYTIGIPAFFIIVGMPLTFSIGNGIGFGLISYVLLMLLNGRYKEIHPVLYIVVALFAWIFMQ